jgi:hypothetical protein
MDILAQLLGLSPEKTIENARMDLRVESGARIIKCSLLFSRVSYIEWDFEFKPFGTRDDMALFIRKR